MNLFAKEDRCVSPNLIKIKLPELPEVQTIVNDLDKKIVGKKILGVLYCDAKKLIKESSFEKFKKEIKNKKILKAERRAKNILVHLSDEKILSVHLKMTGHLLIVKNSKLKAKNLGATSSQIIIKNGKWAGNNLPKELKEPKNQFIHLVLELSGGEVLALSDMRKFAEVKLVDNGYLRILDQKLGPEPLDTGFDIKCFKNIIKSSKGKIKQALMDQSKISGIGNTYADEILFFSGVRPDRLVGSLKEVEINMIFRSIKDILKKAIKLRGTSTADFRDTEGKEGGYQKVRYVYQRKGEKCRKCGSIIKKIKQGGRGTCFCPVCQK